MEDILADLIAGMPELIGFCVSKEGRSFWRDICAMLIGKEVKNRRRNGPVC